MDSPHWRANLTSSRPLSTSGSRGTEGCRQSGACLLSEPQTALFDVKTFAPMSTGVISGPQKQTRTRKKQGVRPMPEIRFEANPETVTVLDAYCQATGTCRTAFINDILNQWAADKLRESIMVCRGVRINPLDLELDRQATGKRGL